MKRRLEYTDYLRDIIYAIEKAEQFVEGIDFISFKANDEKVFAVIRALEIIGEAVKKLPISVRAQYPDVPWQDIAGMRNKLIHEYFGVNIRRVWETVQEDLPPLRDAVMEMLEREHP